MLAIPWLVTCLVKRRVYLAQITQAAPAPPTPDRAGWLCQRLTALRTPIVTVGAGRPCADSVHTLFKAIGIELGVARRGEVSHSVRIYVTRSPRKGQIEVDPRQSSPHN